MFVLLIRELDLKYPKADSAERNKRRRDRVKKTTGEKFVDVKGTQDIQFHHY